LLELELFFGTLAPALRASERPIAIACFGLVTLRPDPLFSSPFLKAFISRSTLLEALGPYFLPLDFFAVDFLLEDLLELLDLLPVDFFLLEDLLELLDFFVGITFSCSE
jgi:hypothetical protein